MNRGGGVSIKTARFAATLSKQQASADRDGEFGFGAFVEVLPEGQLDGGFEGEVGGFEEDAGGDQQLVVAVGFIDAIRFEDRVERALRAGGELGG